MTTPLTPMPRAITDSMRHPVVVLGLTLLLAACATPRPSTPELSPQVMIHAIDLAGQREHSALEVQPLRDAGVQSLYERAHAERLDGRYIQSAHLLDQALAQQPDAPDILQARAEVAIYLHHYVHAEQLARASWKHGPRLGSLCARNWQTVMELRYVAGDQPGVDAAHRRRDACTVKPVTRM